MNFILKMAWRDSRASRSRLLLFSLSVVLGIAALVAIGSLGANLQQAIDDQAKGLLGADLIITSRNPLPEAALKKLDSYGGERATEVGFSSMMMFPAVQNLTRLVAVRGLEGNFPFYGDFVTVPADAPAKFKAGGNVAIVEETLLAQFKTKVGDQVKLGNTMFTVIGSLQKLPGEASALSATMAPRALVPRAALEGTGLGERNTILRNRTMMKLPPTLLPETVEREMRQTLRGEQVGFDTVAERRRNLGRVLENIESFLSLVGFIALFLGAIGIASAIHVYVRQKIPTVAVLRCLGASASQAFAVYVVQGIALGFFGAVVGAALGLAIQIVTPKLLGDLLPFEVTFFFAWPAIARGMGAGFVICVLFTMLPLLAIRKVSPLVALRSAIIEKVSSGPDLWRIGIGVFIVGAVLGFGIWQTGNLRQGVAFTIVIAASFAILAGLAKGVAWGARKWFPRRAPYVVRQGVANLYRPNNRTVLLLLSIGLGTFLMLTLFLVRTTLLKEVEVSGGGGRSNLLFFDIQDDQVDQLKKVTAAEGAPVLVEAPIVTMKIASLKGRKVEDILRDNRVTNAEKKKQAPAAPAADDASDTPDPKNGEPRAKERGSKGGPGGPGNGGDRAPGWTLRREYRSTFRGKLENSERLIQGEFTPKVAPGEPVVPISMEEGLAKDMGVKLGDEIEWDVQGVPLRTKVGSIRAVEWRRLEPNFFVVFPEGVLEPAPKFHVAAVHADNAEHSARVQRAVVSALPNVTAIDLALVMQTIDGIFSKVSFAIEFMAAFTVLTGVIVLFGAVATGRFQRIRETVLLRTLGATERQLLHIQLVEYTILGVLSAIVGGILALAGNALVIKYVFRLTPSVPFLVLGLGTLAVVIVTVASGLLSSRGITNHPPLEVLRQET